MEYEKAAFAFYRHFKKVLGFGNVWMVVADDPDLVEVVTIKCRFTTSHGPYAVEISLHRRRLLCMTEEGARYESAAEAERVKLQLADKKIGVLARGVKV